MRGLAGAEGVRALAKALGAVAPPDTRLYLTGGATAVIEGWRERTVDIDLRIEPEDDGVMRRIVELKEELDVNVEFASPPDFIPELPGWRERSPFVLAEGNLSVHHFDPYSQALSKVERGFDLDLVDVAAMIERGMVNPAHALELYERIEPELFRYPAIDPGSFRTRVERAFVQG